MRRKLSKRSDEALASAREHERAREGFWVRLGCGGVLGFALGVGAVFGGFGGTRHAFRIFDDGWFALACVVAATFFGAVIAARGRDDDLLDFVASFAPHSWRRGPRTWKSMEAPSAPSADANPRDQPQRSERD